MPLPIICPFPLYAPPHFTQTHSESTAQFRLTIGKFSNPSYKLTDGHCCDSPSVARSRDFRCPPHSCNYAMVVCVKQYQENFVRRADCVFGDFTVYLGTGSGIAGISQTFMLNFTWPVSV